MRTFVSFGLLFLLLSSGIVAIGAKTMAVSGTTQHAPASVRTAVPPRSDGEVRLPPVDGRFDYQIGGPYTPAPGTEVVVRDREADPAPGLYNVCYVDVFQTQPGTGGWWERHHPELLLRHRGDLVEDPGWPGQYLFDTSTRAGRDALLHVQEDWLRGCAERGYDAVEADNLDSWSRSGGSITRADNLAMAKQIVRSSHRLGMAVAQKNGAVLRGRGERVAGFDFAVAESCEVYRECDSYTDAYGARVYEIEYTDTPGAFERACRARGDGISITLRDRMVVPAGAPGHRTATC